LPFKFTAPRAGKKGRGERRRTTLTRSAVEGGKEGGSYTCKSSWTRKGKIVQYFESRSKERGKKNPRPASLAAEGKKRGTKKIFPLGKKGRNQLIGGSISVDRKKGEADDFSHLQKKRKKRGKGPAHWQGAPKKKRGTKNFSLNPPDRAWTKEEEGQKAAERSLTFLPRQQGKKTP